jgi:phage-related protein
VMSAGMGVKLVGALKAATVGFGKLAVAILTNPVFLLAAVIIGLGVVIWKFRTQIMEGIVGAFNFVRERVGAVVDWFRGVFDRLGDRIRDVFTRVGNTIRSVFQSVVGFVKNIINQLIGMFERVFNGPANAANRLIRTANRLPGVNIPELPTLNIPRLAEGGDIKRAGRVMVGEEGPEFLDLPRGARVTPLNNSGDTNITMNVTVQGASFDEDKLARALDRIARDAAATSTYRRPQ